MPEKDAAARADAERERLSAALVKGQQGLFKSVTVPEVMVDLYHRTPHGPKVMAEGFKVGVEGFSWLSDTIEDTSTGQQGEWLVIVTMPAGVANAHQRADQYGRLPHTFAFLAEELNGYQRRLEPWTG